MYPQDSCDKRLWHFDASLWFNLQGHFTVTGNDGICEAGSLDKKKSTFFDMFFYLFYFKIFTVYTGNGDRFITLNKRQFLKQRFQAEVDENQTSHFQLETELALQDFDSWNLQMKKDLFLYCRVKPPNDNNHAHGMIRKAAANTMLYSDETSKSSIQ